MKQKILIAFNIALFVLLFFVALLAVRLANYKDRPIIPANRGIYFEIRPGTSVKQFAYDLHAMGVLRKPHYFVLLVRIKGLSKEIQAGKYRFAPLSTPNMIINKITSGEVISESLTFIEGWNVKQVMKAIDLNHDIKHTLTALNEHDIMAALGKPSLAAEGQFFPDTYHFNEGASDISLLEKAHRELVKRLNSAWAQRDKSVPYTSPQQALIVASILEKEAADPKERHIIAGVIINRLNKKMYLQLDPTVIYGLGDKFTGHLTLKDLRTESPYNTYLNKGLPPTPIAIASMNAIVAALHPIGDQYLYFVSKGDGTHIFSKTLQEHEAAVQQYHLQKRDGRS